MAGFSPKAFIFFSLNGGSGQSEKVGIGVAPGFIKDSVIDVLPSTYFLKLSNVKTRKQVSNPRKTRTLKIVNLDMVNIFRYNNPEGPTSNYLLKWIFMNRL